jgi:hypothetical protein
MFRELRLQRIDAAAARTAAQKISDGDAQSLASLNVVVASEIGIGEDEYAWTDGRVIGFAKLNRGTRQQAAKLHFKKRQSGREAGISRAAANARSPRLANLFDGEHWDGAAAHASGRPGFGWFIELCRM